MNSARFPADDPPPRPWRWSTTACAVVVTIAAALIAAVIAVVLTVGIGYFSPTPKGTVLNGD